MKYVKFVKESWKFRPLWMILLVGVLGMAITLPIQGRLLYTRSDNSQAPSFEPFDSSEVEAAAADDHSTHSHGIGHLPDRGRFTQPDEPNSWPPQYRGMDNVEWDEQPASNSRSASAMNKAQSIAENDVDVSDLLGTRSTFINTAPIETKWESEVAGYTVTWFSYSNNVTIDAVVKNGEVVEVQAYDAADYQPPLRQNEVDDAIEIARQYWIDQGQDRVDQLLGYTIQTLQTEGEGGYYDTRMTYVSFHTDQTSEPLLMSWVDLTHQTVVRGVIDTAVTDVQPLTLAEDEEVTE